MRVIWQNEAPISTVAIREVLQRERPWKLSALQTLLGRLVKRGFLATQKEGKHRFYAPLISEEGYLAEDSRRYFRKWMGGSLRELVARIYENHSATKGELEELKAFLEQNTKE